MASTFLPSRHCPVQAAEKPPNTAFVALFAWKTLLTFRLPPTGLSPSPCRLHCTCLLGRQCSLVFDTGCCLPGEGNRSLLGDFPAIHCRGKRKRQRHPSFWEAPAKLTACACVCGCSVCTHAHTPPLHDMHTHHCLWPCAAHLTPFSRRRPLISSSSSLYPGPCGLPATFPNTIPLHVISSSLSPERKEHTH